MTKVVHIGTSFNFFFASLEIRLQLSNTLRKGICELINPDAIHFLHDPKTDEGCRNNFLHSTSLCIVTARTAIFILICQQPTLLGFSAPPPHHRKKMISNKQKPRLIGCWSHSADDETVLVSGVFVLVSSNAKTAFAARGNPIHFDVPVPGVVYP